MLETLLLLVAMQIPPVKNPRHVILMCDDSQNVTLTCADAKQVTSYELDILRPDLTVVQTLTVPAVPPDASNQIDLPVNVQPTAFGSYTFVARAVAGSIKTSNSPNSDPWERAPGPPSKPVVK